MKTIWKYPVEVRMTLSLPKHAEVLTVALQHGVPMMWVLVDPDAPLMARHFAMYGTGDNVGEWLEKADYIGTFQLDGGTLIFHCFEVSH